MAPQIYQIKITLNGSKPKVWRRLLVYSDTMLDDMHRIIQTSMGWKNSHLHLFDDGINQYAPSEFEVAKTMDSRAMNLKAILKNQESIINYVYDLGDRWEHEILLEEILMEYVSGQIPKCISGKSSCPPEDCGGIYGYTELLSIISNPKHEEYESMIDWLGDDFDPNYFDMNEINIALNLKNYGCGWNE